MKRIKDFPWHHGTGYCKTCHYSEEQLKKELISQIRSWLQHYPDIRVEDIKHVGILEDGRLQFKIPTSIKDRQVIMLIAWIMWFYSLETKDIKGGE